MDKIPLDELSKYLKTYINFPIRQSVPKPSSFSFQTPPYSFIEISSSPPPVLKSYAHIPLLKIFITPIYGYSNTILSSHHHTGSPALLA
jgi:hypothetical protein